MTTTTRTMTRKTPWAAALTALLAVLALVFGVMAFAGVANAKDNGNDKAPPGHSDTFVPPGQDDTALPPGKDPNFVPPGQLPEGTAKKVYVCHADVNNGNGNTNLGVEDDQGNGTGGQSGTGFNLLYISTAAATNAHMKLHSNDYYATDAEVAQGFCGTAPTTERLCDLTAVPPAMVPFDNPSAAYTAALANTAQYAATCPSVKKTTPAWLCELKAVPPAMKEFPDNTAKVYTDALADTANWAAICPITVDQATAIDAAIATTVPEPATVAPVQPAKVAVPAAAKPMPATVPAGDGSSVPQAPVALLALLALATAAAVTSGLRVAKNR